MGSQKVQNYLECQKDATDKETADLFSKFEELYNKKLWHQLTLALVKGVKIQYFSDCPGRLRELYDNFLSDFEHRINPLSLIEVASLCARDMPDASAAVEYLEKMRGKVKQSHEAQVYADIVIARIHLSSKELDTVKKMMSDIRTRVDEIDGISNTHSMFYELSSDYFKLKGDHASYYRETLRYLGCIDISDMEPQVRIEKAYSMGLAALLGVGVYNFGELLEHPILECLISTDKYWIVELLHAFNAGDIEKFEQKADTWKKQPDLAGATTRLYQKLALLSLMEMSFSRSSNNQRLAFDEIAKTTRIPENEVELLVMKALSLKLIKGSINQVEKYVTVTWLQPRVLNKQQLSNMHTRLTEWCKDVQQMQNLVQTHAEDILV